MSTTPDRMSAFELLKTYTKTESLIAHALSVEGVMRHFALKYKGDPEKWGIIGLVHDIDYEMFPDEHCIKAEEILNKADWPQDYIRAVISHGWGLCRDIKPESMLEKVLYATDELTGLVTTTALVRPSKSVLDMKAKSVKKKWKDKRFAAGVNREVIQTGTEMLEMELTELITETILGMRTVADQIGLRGTC